MKTEMEIVEETIEYYKSHKRGIVTNDKGAKEGCMYLTPDGDKCAVGRCLTPTGLEIAMRDHWGSIDCVEGLNIDEVVKEQYRNKSIEFWQDLQQLHDRADYWRKTDKGNELTGLGKSYVEGLKKEYEKH